jgi:hypothetical protein
MECENSRYSVGKIANEEYGGEVAVPKVGWLL